MERFLKRHESRHSGSITGIDRILFRGILRSISYVEGLNYFMGNQRVPFKGFGAFVEKFSAGVRRRTEAIAKRAGRPFLYLGWSRTDKEKLAREVIERDRIKEGLVCILSCVEPCQPFGIRRDREKRQLQLVARERKCLHLYFYFLNRDFGLMHIRLQTRLPLSIQVCVNGREWLARQMKRAGIEYEQQDNCFTSIADPARAQTLMDRLGDYPWAKWLNRRAQWVNPWLGPQVRPQLRGLLLDGAAKRMRHRRNVLQSGSVGGGLSGFVPAGYGAILFTPGAAFSGTANQHAFQRRSLQSFGATGGRRVREALRGRELDQDV
jgi:hypothetical protein